MSAYPRLLFLSYAHADSVAVRRSFVEFLRDAGLAIWIDRSGIRAGQDWAVEIRSAIASCDIFLVFLSPNSLSEKSYVKQEITWALQQRKVIVPVRIAPFDNAALPANLDGLQWVDFSDPDDSVWEQRSRDLLQELKRHDERTKPLPNDLNILLPEPLPQSLGDLSPAPSLPIPAPPSDDWIEIRPRADAARSALKTTSFFVSRLVSARDIDVFRRSADYAEPAWWTRMGLGWLEQIKGQMNTGEQSRAASYARVSWYEAFAFSRWLSYRHFEALDRIRLPREAEWMESIHQVKDKGFTTYGEEWCMTAFALEYDEVLEDPELRGRASSNYLFDVLRTVCSWIGPPEDVARRAMMPNNPEAGFRLVGFSESWLSR